MRYLSRLGVAALVASFAVTSVQAAFVAPAFRGGADTTYQEWNVFTSSAGPNTPDVANSNVNGTANVVETSGGSFVTSGGNIYSFSVPTFFTVTVPDFDLGSGYVTNAVVQIRTQGTPVDTTSVLFNGVAANSATLLYTEALGGFGGALEDWKFIYTGVLSNLAVDTITFNATGSSLSLDRVSVDTQATAVPEAGSLVLGGLVSVVAACVIRRRRQG